MGTEEEQASGNPFLVIYDDYSESLFTIAVPSKEYGGWLADFVKATIDELGYGETRVALKSDNAPELLKLRTEVAARRRAPTVPITIPVKASKSNGAIERAIRSWQGQFRTLKDHVEYETNSVLGPRHPILTWCAWWSAVLLNRVKITERGRTPHELTTGHRSRAPLAAFGEKIHWRSPRAISRVGKFTSEWSYGVFLGISGAEVVIGTEEGIKRSRDIRRLPDDESWDRGILDKCKITFREYLDPSSTRDDDFDIPVIPHDNEDEVEAVPHVGVAGGVRRMMLRPDDFKKFGYTGGCQGCIALQTSGMQRRRHNDMCRSRIEAALIKTPEG